MVAKKSFATDRSKLFLLDYTEKKDRKAMGVKGMHHSLFTAWLSPPTVFGSQFLSDLNSSSSDNSATGMKQGWPKDCQKRDEHFLQSMITSVKSSLRPY